MSVVYKISTDVFDSAKDEIKECFDYFYKKCEKYGTISNPFNFDSLMGVRNQTEDGENMIFCIPSVAIRDVFIKGSFGFNGINLDVDDDKKFNISWYITPPSRIEDEKQLNETRNAINKIDGLIDAYYDFVEELVELTT